MEIEVAKTKYCWKCLPAQVPCHANMCMGWQPQSELVTKLISYSDPIPAGWHDKGSQQKHGVTMRLVGKFEDTTRGWCDALPKDVE